MNEADIYNKLFSDGWTMGDPCPHCGCRALYTKVSLLTIFYCVWCNSIGGVVDNTLEESETS